MAELRDIRATWANSDNPMAYMIVRVDAPGLRMYVWESNEVFLEVAGNKRATTDLRRAMDRAEWEREYGALATYDELLELIQEACRE